MTNNLYQLKTFLTLKFKINIDKRFTGSKSNGGKKLNDALKKNPTLFGGKGSSSKKPKISKPKSTKNEDKKPEPETKFKKSSPPLTNKIPPQKNPNHTPASLVNSEEFKKLKNEQPETPTSTLIFSYKANIVDNIVNSIQNKNPPPNLNATSTSTPIPVPILKPMTNPKPAPTTPIPTTPTTPTTPIPTTPIPTSEIPTPPPLPHTKPNKGVETCPITPETLNEQKKKLKSFAPVIPSNTNITEKTTISDISDSELIQELKARKLIVDDHNKHTTSKLQTVDDKKIEIGGNQFNVKITPLCAALASELPEVVETLPDLISDDENFEFKLVVVYANDKTMIPSGKQTHINVVVVVNKATNSYYALGYLTSKSSGEFISDEQFNVFQYKQENPEYIEPEKKKNQYFVHYQNFEKLDPTKLTFLKWDLEYLEKIKNRDLIVDISKKLMKNPIILFNELGFTKQNLLDICHSHDKKIKNQIPLPKTKDQIELDKKNSEKQKFENEQKKLANKILNEEPF